MEPEDLGLPKPFCTGENLGEPVADDDTVGCVGADEARARGEAVEGGGGGEDGPGLSPSKPRSLSVTGALRTRSAVLGVVGAGTGGGGGARVVVPAFPILDPFDAAEGTAGAVLGISAEEDDPFRPEGEVELDGASDKPANKSPVLPDMTACVKLDWLG